MVRADHQLSIIAGILMVFAGLLSLATAARDGELLTGWTVLHVVAMTVGGVLLMRAWRARRSRNKV